MTMIEIPNAEGSRRILFSREAEDAALGACLINSDQFPLARAIASPADFYNQKDRWIWDAMTRLWKRHEAIDITTVGLELGRDRLEEVGGMAYLMKLSNLLGSSFNADAYARIVHDQAVLRHLVAAAERTAVAAYREGASAAEVSALAYRELRSASMEIAEGPTSTIREVLAASCAEAEARNGQSCLPGIPTGFAELDSKLGGGFGNGQLILVAGFPGGGKSSLMTQMAAYAGLTRWVRFHSLEMPVTDLGFRFVAQASGVNSQAIRTGRLSDDERQKVDAAIAELSNRKIFFDGRLPMSVPLMKVGALRAQAEGQLQILFVDYSGLMSSPGEREYERHSALSHDFKVLAQDLKIPVCVAHQLNRRGYEEEAPDKQHLRSSGTWEQDADVVLIVHRTKEPARGGRLPCRLKVAKQRNGPTGYVDLLFRPETTKFEEG